MRRLALVLVSLAFFGQATAVAQAQSSRVLVEQINVRRSLPTRAAPPSAANRESLESATSSQRAEASQTDALSSELLAACQAGVAPPGVRCPEAMGNRSNARPPRTPEGTLLQIFGVPRSFTTRGSAPSSTNNANAVARELGAEGGQGNVSSEAAGAVQRQRSSPPPTSSR